MWKLSSTEPSLPWNSSLPGTGTTSWTIAPDFSGRKAIGSPSTFVSSINAAAGTVASRCTEPLNSGVSGTSSSSTGRPRTSSAPAGPESRRKAASDLRTEAGRSCALRPAAYSQSASSILPSPRASRSAATSSTARHSAPVRDTTWS